MAGEIREILADASFSTQGLWAVQGLPENGKPGSVALYACALVAMNSLGSWAGPACNNPAFADIVPAHMRNLVFAFDRCFEGAVAACAAPLVGMLAEKRFGFKVSLTSTSIVFYCLLMQKQDTVLMHELKHAFWRE